jgi:hypothetical protein
MLLSAMDVMCNAIRRLAGNGNSGRWIIDCFIIESLASPRISGKKGKIDRMILARKKWR